MPKPHLVRIPDDLWQELVEIAADQRRSVANFIEVALREAIEMDPFLDNMADRKTTDQR